ncbi:ethanolamine ammonia-lyase subunit EutC [Pseudomonas sp. NCCP-436]|uniref:ethanolamine ammonia-lyase subunit EutC n=1 Tax=Pseudomonas sp. NCCP-436 TaxID=2842481 RepID=UPI001C80B7B3|nr:ethanolamine ammonia-lyase subunit EutC [Pseudomonas sp. NCCP-436]GIZ12903.1 ethanolamine ammonia-lyase light chain [Pseudomonas sp. NCCP-436]
MSIKVVTSNPWERLRQFTNARIALGRAGSSLPTRPWLDFQLAHAQARDAVHLPLDAPALSRALRQRFKTVLSLHSAATDRQTYLRRPDLGRVLDEASTQQLQALGGEPCDLAFVIADGLSAMAVQQHAVPFIDALLPQLQSAGLTIGPASIVLQGRVAVGDPVGELLRARLVLVLIGERPGLSSPDSLGLYLTYAPRSGRHDAERNCISNIRPAGQPVDEAAARAAYLLREALRRGLSGVALKDETQTHELGAEAPQALFRLSTDAV